MRKQAATVLVLVFLVLGFAINSVAEPQEESDRPPTKEQMEKVRTRIETLRMWKLTKALDLDEKKSAQLFPLLNKYDKKRAETESAMRDNMRDLRESLKERREVQIKNALDRLELNHKSMQNIREAEREELKGILSIEQQARFIIFQQEFDREIRKIIEETRERRQDMLRRDMPQKPSPPQR